MQAENIKNNIKALSFGCRLNALECEKITAILADFMPCPAILVNTCAVTAEAERQSGQAVRKLSRENPDVPIFVTGCAATRNPGLFAKIPSVIVIPNADKTNRDAYVRALGSCTGAEIIKFEHSVPTLSKQFIQVQNGCNHNCAYCVTRLLRGTSVSFDYETILADVRTAINNGFSEIVLTGVDTASYMHDGMRLSDLCRQILKDAPEIKRFRLSSLDPASPEIFKILDLIKTDARMMPHIHLSMQSGSDTILRAMHRTHTADKVRDLVRVAGDDITFSWDIICGFPGESDELFSETLDLTHELKPIHVHAFPFSPRPMTVAATMPHQIDRHIAKQRVRQITRIATQNLHKFMQGRIGQTVQVLTEENNTARDPHDIPVCITGCPIPARTVCNVRLTDAQDNGFIGERC